MLTRFAPSPTGPLHLGHAYSAVMVWTLAADLGGAALLRIEDTDSTRCRPEYEAAIYDDLHWLGLHWPDPVRRQSDHRAEYDATLDALAGRGLLYPCSCSRSAIKAAGAKPGWDGLVYPGTCRARPMTEARPGDALRLNMARALQQAGPLPEFTETGPLFSGKIAVQNSDLISQIGDPVLRRKQTGDPAYHLACCHDDALQGITHVVRGADLWRATFLHVLLQALMGWQTPIYHHHDLVRDEAGQRLAKIVKSRAIAAYRAEGFGPKDLLGLIGLA
ncbi:MAG: glutamyl-Q tRNA(Asp) synthetase GluQ [Rhodobacteraceae bacterium HLUCCA08]|nr:MAG: glutamyl-Q tRNA(Asp) synthetase GluQ [Rhodobacteraceae bacterium HLUCCA08]